MFDTNLQESSSRKTSRRAFLFSSAVLGGGLYLWIMGFFSKKTETAETSEQQHSAQQANAGQPQEVDIVEFTDTGERKDTVHVPKLVKNDNEWKQQLSPAAYDITRHDGTEMAFT